MLLAQTTGAPEDEGDQDVARGASDTSRVFSPVWLVVAAVGFLACVVAGMVWRKRQKP